MRKKFGDFDNALSLFKKIKDGNITLEKVEKIKMNKNQIQNEIKKEGNKSNK